jgi:peptidoglycan/LPS O-acetylase OafA/YrhL
VNKVQSTKLETIGSIYNPKQNNFHLVRFLLAMGVIYSHSFDLLGAKGEFVSRLTHGQSLLSTFSVNGFFVVSGFLVTQSLCNSSGIIDFLGKRVFRIIPAYLASLLLSAFVLGPLVTNLNLHSYFTSEPFLFVIKNLSFGIRGDAFGILDVFAHNPYPNVVNGSIWTLKYEIALYLILGFSLVIPYFKTKTKVTLIFAIVTLAALGNLVFGVELTKSTNLNYWVLNAWNYKFFVSLAFYFFIGGITYLFRNKIPHHTAFQVIAFIGLVASSQVDALKYGSLIFFPYLLLTTSINDIFHRFGKYGDYSYGLYIYAFPIQQLVVFLLGKFLTVSSFFFTAFAATLAVSVASWHLLEKPALRLKNSFAPKKDAYWTSPQFKL